MSSHVKEWLQEARSKYLEAKALAERTDDPVKEPFKSKYKAAEILRGLKTQLNEFQGNDDVTSYQLSLVKALLEYELGVIAYETEEPCTCEEYHKSCWEFLKDHAGKRECIVVAVNVLNSLGILRAARGDQEEAKEYLVNAELLYGEYKLGKKDSPYLLEDLFFLHDDSVIKADWKQFEKAVTHTLYYLAQVYEHLGENESSAKYCHITLKRQLDSSDYDPLDWAVNCANLSQYFAAKERFGAARHVLACASYMMAQYKEKLEADEKSATDEKWEYFERGMADIAICWAKYGLQLLATSLDKKVQSQETNDSNSASESEESDDIIQVYRLFKESKVKELENQMTCCLITNFEQAKHVFLSAVDFLSKAKSYYTLNSHAYDYVQITQDNSKLYKFLVGFETDKERQCKMHKRRVDMLEEMLRKLNPQHYLGLCQQLMFELAETYSEMMDIKLSLANVEKSQITPHALKKINFLANKSIEHYESFINSMRDSKKLLPETFSDDSVRPLLVAHFCLGRLYSKLIVPEQNKQVEYLKKSEEYYNFVVKYVEKNPQHEKSIAKELPVIKEMAELVPVKMRSILNLS